MTEYRQLPKSDCWHFHPKCRWWPHLRLDRAYSFNSRTEKPTTGELCNECQAKTRRDSQ